MVPAVFRGVVDPPTEHSFLEKLLPQGQMLTVSTIEAFYYDFSKPCKFASLLTPQIWLPVFSYSQNLNQCWQRDVLRKNKFGKGIASWTIK